MSLAAMTALALTTPDAWGATLTLRAYDEDGNLLSTSEFLARTTAGSAGWRNDLVYRIADGTAVAHLPIVDSGGLPALDITEADSGLAVAWPTVNTGYSTLFLDNLGAGLAGGTIVFNERAALDVRAKLDDAITRRPAYVASAAIFKGLRHDGVEPEGYHVLDRCIHFQVVQPQSQPYERGLCLQNFEAAFADE